MRKGVLSINVVYIRLVESLALTSSCEIYPAMLKVSWANLRHYRLVKDLKSNITYKSGYDYVMKTQIISKS